MQLENLKKEIQASIEVVEDELLLLEIAEIIKQHQHPEYESTPEFIAAINKSIEEADNGEVYEHEEVMNWLKERTWRTK